MAWRAALAVMVLGAAGLGFGGDRTPGLPLILRVEDARRGETIHAETVAPGARFVLSYVHSSEHVTVRGTFRIEPDGALTVTETAFQGFGPGLPAVAPAGAWHTEHGMFVLRDPGTTMPALTVRVEPATRHRLVVPSGLEIDLSAVVPPRGAVRIRATAARS